MRKIFFGLILFVMMLAIGGKADCARLHTLQGSVTVVNDYNSNVFMEKDGATDEWNTTVAPVISWHVSGEKDTFDVRVAPEFSYNYRRDEMSYVRPSGYDDDASDNNLLSFDVSRKVAQHMRIAAGGTYSYFDSPVFETGGITSIPQLFLRADTGTRAEVVRLLFPELDWDPRLHMAYVLTNIQQRYDEASHAIQQQVDDLLQPAEGDNARQRYWDTELYVESEYEFAKNSFISLYYTYTMDDNRTILNRADKMSHDFNVKVDYQLRRWRWEMSYGLKREYFDISNNSQTDNPVVRVEYDFSPDNTWYWEHDYSKLTYDEGGNGSIRQTSTLGWDLKIGKHMSVTADLDGSYLDSEGGRDERAVTFSPELDYFFERGSVNLTFEGIYGENADNGHWWKQRRSWEIGSSVNYRIQEDLSSTVDCSYGDWQTWFAGERTQYDRFEVGTGLTYSFGEWFSLGVDYSFRLFETTSSGLDDFNEHRLSLSLSAGNKIAQW